MTKDSKIIVIGSGAFGISAAYHLSEAGYTNITVFDKGDYNHNLFDPLKGANAPSTDYNKLVRASYIDKTHYQNLALQSLQIYYKWNEQLEHAAFLPNGLKNTDKIFRNTGYVRFDDVENKEEAKTLAHFEKQGLRSFEYDINNEDDILRSKITGWYSKIDPLGQKGKVKTLTGVLDSIAGVVNANKGLLWLKYLSERSGNVKFVFGPLHGEIEKIIYSDATKIKAVGVQTKDGKKHDADFVVIAAGGYTPAFLPSEKRDRIESVASTIIFLQIPHDRPDLLKKYQNIPMINWRMRYQENTVKDGIYMFPATEEGIIKIGANDELWRYFDENNETLKNVSTPTDKFKLLPKESFESYKTFFSQWLKDLKDANVHIEKSKFCFDAISQKNEFVIDFVPGTENVIISSGGSFHGFKFLPIIGRFVEGLISKKNYQYSEYFKFDSIKDNDFDRKPLKDVYSDHSLKYAGLVERKQDYFEIR